MAAQQLTDLNGFYKTIYGDKLINSIPDNAKLLKRIPFEKRNQLGSKYAFPVVVSMENGATYNSDGSAFTINSNIPYTTQSCEFTAPTILLESKVSMDAVAQGMNDKTSFGNTITKLTQMLTESHAKRAEIAMWYGGTGLARVSASANVNATKTTVTITPASWASGIWTGSKSAQIHFYANDNSTLISSGADAIFTIYSVDHVNKKLTVTGTISGISALDSSTFTGGGLYIYFYNAKSTEMSGVDKICTNTSTLFNIDASVYDTWLANTPTTSGDLSFSKIIEAVIPAAGRGLEKPVHAFISPFQYTKLASDAASLRKLDTSYKKSKYENGFDGTTEGSLTFFGVSGQITIEPHNMIKNGDAFILPLDSFKRIGSRDIELDEPNGKGNGIFTSMESSAAYRFRSFSNFGILSENPCWCTKLTGFNAS